MSYYYLLSFISRLLIQVLYSQCSRIPKTFSFLFGSLLPKDFLKLAVFLYLLLPVDFLHRHLRLLSIAEQLFSDFLVRPTHFSSTERLWTSNYPLLIKLDKCRCLAGRYSSLVFGSNTLTCTVQLSTSETTL